MIRIFLTALMIAIAWSVYCDAREPVIYFNHSSDCGPCRQWEKRDLPAWERVGWRVEKVIELAVRPVPWFRIYDSDGVTFEVVGPLTGDNFRAAKAKAIRQQRSWID